MKKVTLLFALTVLFAFTASAQKIKKQSGDLSSLGGSSLFVRFDYSDMTVGKKLSEEEYVTKKVTEYNDKEAGKGDKWKEGWLGAREDRYEPKFMELFKKNVGNNVTVTENEEEAKYTLIVKTTYTEPGFNVGVMRQNAYIHVDYIIVENENPTNIVAHYTQQKVPGAQAMGYDFDAGSRIAESYAKAGKMFGKFVSKEVK